MGCSRKRTEPGGYICNTSGVPIVTAKSNITTKSFLPERAEMRDARYGRPIKRPLHKRAYGDFAALNRSPVSTTAKTRSVCWILEGQRA